MPDPIALGDVVFAQRPPPTPEYDTMPQFIAGAVRELNEDGTAAKVFYVTHREEWIPVAELTKAVRHYPLEP